MRGPATFIAATLLSGCVPSSTVLDNCAEGCCGGACIDNVCQPVELTARSDISEGLEVGGDYVYYCTGSIVRRVPKAGGDVAEFSGIGSNNICWSLRADELSQRLYVGSAQGIFIIDTQNGKSLPLGNEASKIDAELIVVTDDAVIWSGAWKGFQGVFRSELSTGATRSLPFPTDDALSALTLGPDGRVYWADGMAYDVWVTSPDGTGSVKLHQGRPPTMTANFQLEPSKLAVDRAYVYYVQAGSMFRVAVNGRLPAEVIAPSAVTHGISVDEHGVFWSDVGSGRIAALRFIDPGHPEALLSGMRTRNLVADEACLYFQEESSGAIYKLAKPRSP